MKLHFSVDDVIFSLMDLHNNMPSSVFDVPFFNFLKNMNEKYNALFTLYAFENYAETFYVDSIPEKYWKEFESCGFIRFGFHGVFNESNSEIFKSKCQRFYSCVPETLRAGTVRIHEYQGNTLILNTLKEYGVSTLLTREDESKKYGDFPPSYIFSEDEEKNIFTKAISKNGFNFIKTIFRIEFYETSELTQKLNELISGASFDDVISIFTHEEYCDKYKNSIEAVCKSVYNSQVIEFTF